VKKFLEITENTEELPAKYRWAFLWYDAKNPNELGSYKLPFVDVVDGQLKAVPRAIFTAAASIQGARGGVAISTADEAEVKAHIDLYYSKMQDQFDDDELISPWNRAGKSIIDVYTEKELKALNNIFNAYGIPCVALIAAKEDDTEDTDENVIKTVSELSKQYISDEEMASLADMIRSGA